MAEYTPFAVTQSSAQMQTALDKVGTTALTTTATDLSGAVNELDADITAKGVRYYASQTVNVASNAEIFRITNASITTDTVVLECVFADPSYITSDITWTSYSGYIAFTGTCTTATTANVTIATKVN